MHFLRSEKGQESAVFELLIAVIIMTFVIVIGFNALDKLNDNVCKGQMNQTLERIRTTLEEVVNTKNKANVSYELPVCFAQNQSTLKIVVSDSQQQCSAQCGGSISHCMLLIFSSPSYTESKCLRISSVTNFPEGDPCDAKILEPSDGYTLVNWQSEQGITPGTYALFEVTSLSNSGPPQICAFRRK